MPSRGNAEQRTCRAKDMPSEEQAEYNPLTVERSNVLSAHLCRVQPCMPNVLVAERALGVERYSIPNVALCRTSF